MRVRTDVCLSIDAAPIVMGVAALEERLKTLLGARSTVPLGVRFTLST